MAEIPELGSYHLHCLCFRVLGKVSALHESLLCTSAPPPFLPDVLRGRVVCRTLLQSLLRAVPAASCYQLQWTLCCILPCLQSHHIPPSRGCDIPRADPHHVPTGDSGRKFCSPGWMCISLPGICRSRSPALGAICRKIHPQTYVALHPTVLLCVCFPVGAPLQQSQLQTPPTTWEREGRAHSREGETRNRRHRYSRWRQRDLRSIAQQYEPQPACPNVLYIPSASPKQTYLCLLEVMLYISSIVFYSSTFSGQ